MRAIIFKDAKHLSECRHCSYRYICDGLWRNYIKYYKCAEVFPIKEIKTEILPYSFLKE